MMATFNSAEYGWADIDIVLLGKKVAGVRGIEYTVKQEKEVIYASGNEPRGFGFGNKSYEGSLTLLQSEVQALEFAAGIGNDIVDIHGATITVAYAPKSGGIISIDTILYVEFEEVKKGMKQNDKYAEITLPFKALKIRKGV